MFLIYEGPHLEVEVPHDDGSYQGAVIYAERGKAVEVPDEVAADLLAQGEENEDQIPRGEGGAPSRSAQHARTWRKATSKETAAAQKASGADSASESSDGTATAAGTDGNTGEGDRS